jgi:hypothetical protein
MTLRLSLLVPLLLIVAGCSSDGAGAVAQQQPAVRIIDRGPNAVALWDERAAAIINQPPWPAGTPEERQPTYQLDMATPHLSIHEAVSVSPLTSQEAAANAAGYTVLKTLFPQRAAQYQSAYDAARRRPRSIAPHG